MVMFLDVIHIDGILHTGPLIDIAYPTPQVRIIDDPLLVTLEVALKNK